jgi:hypothetical protein
MMEATQAEGQRPQGGSVAQNPDCPERPRPGGQRVQSKRAIVSGPKKHRTYDGRGMYYLSAGRMFDRGGGSVCSILCGCGFASRLPGLIGGYGGVAWGETGRPARPNTA